MYPSSHHLKLRQLHIPFSRLTIQREEPSPLASLCKHQLVYSIRVIGVRCSWFWRNRNFRRYISSDNASGHLAWIDSFSNRGRESVIWCSVNGASVLQLRRQFHQGPFGLSPDPKSISRISTTHTSFYVHPVSQASMRWCIYYKALDLGGFHVWLVLWEHSSWGMIPWHVTSQPGQKVDLHFILGLPCAVCRYAWQADSIAEYSQWLHRARQARSVVDKCPGIM